MKTKSSSIFKDKKKEFAQSFVEFALAVPILLLVLYGLLEAGRLLFIYSSTVTAARQAVRYGAVTGVNDLNIPRFQDCDGIRAAAQGVGFINKFENIKILYDEGPDDAGIVPAPYDECDGSFDLFVQPKNGHRLLVSVSAIFVPIVPLVPLEPMTIESSSSRTILVDIDIVVTPKAQGWDGSTSTPSNTPTNTNTPTATATATSTPTPKKSPTPTQTPTITLTPTITYTPSITNTPTNTFTATATGTATFTPSPTATPIECFVSHNGLSITQDKMLLTVHNDSDYPITISGITAFYDATTPAGQGLTAVYAGGTLIWDSFKTGSPVTISSFIANEPIAPWSSVALKLFFEKNIRHTGMENIMISFVENGCPVHETAP